MCKAINAMTNEELLNYLQSADIDDLRNNFKTRKTQPIEKKRLAWQLMDTGVYGLDGKLIGDNLEYADRY